MNLRILMHRETGLCVVGFKIYPLGEYESFSIQERSWQVVMVEDSDIFWCIQSSELQPFVFITDTGLINEQLKDVGEL